MELSYHVLVPLSPPAETKKDGAGAPFFFVTHGRFAARVDVGIDPYAAHL